MSNPRCPMTDEPMERGVRPLVLTYKGKSITFDMPGWYCASSEEGIHTGKDMKISDRALNKLKAEVEGLLLPEDIRRIRKKLKLTQVNAGKVVGGGPRAFQKYEMGDLLPSRAISSALKLLDHDPSSLSILESQPPVRVAAAKGKKNSLHSKLPKVGADFQSKQSLSGKMKKKG